MPFPKIKLAGDRELSGTRRPVAPDAPAVERLLGYLGLKIRHRPPDIASRPPRTVPPTLHARADDIPARGREIGAAERQRIVAHMRDGLQNWKRQAGASTSDDHAAPRLKQDHVMMALLLDGVFKHHIGSSSGAALVDSVPTDQSLKAMLHEAYGADHPKGFDSSAHETMRVLYQDFDAEPFLRDIPRHHRWRLLVDRNRVDALGEQLGIDTANPLLGLVCDSEPHRARNLANGWSFMVRAVTEGRAFDRKLLLEMAQSCGAGQVTAEGVVFGSTYSKADARALAEWMMTLRADYGIGSFVVVRDDLVLAAPYVRKPSIGSAQSSSASSGPTVDSATRALQGQIEAAWNASTSKTWTFSRNATSEAKIHCALDDISAKASQAMRRATRHDERLSTAASAYIDGFRLHPLSDGNSRLTMLALNYLLLSQREPISLIHRPARVDDRRDAGQRLVDIVQEGQDWLSELG
jgi:hypothetical protein